MAAASLQKALQAHHVVRMAVADPDQAQRLYLRPG